MSRVKLTDTVFRDAHQSLLATRMRTRDMLPIAEKMDQVGFFSLETWGGATFDTCIRYLNEDPWERLRALKKAMPNTPMQMLLRGQNLVGYRHYADDVVDKFVEKAATNGVDIFRIFDAVNDIRNMERSIKAAKKMEKHIQGGISYTISPVHSNELFAQFAVKLAELGCDSICIKDMAGLLKPFDAYELVKAIKSKVDIPVQVHSHSTTGMSVATLTKAAEAGADTLDTVISSMSMGTSHSPTETIVEILKGTEFDTGLDIKALLEIAAYFREVRKKYAKFESKFLGADTRILVSQVPGGMLSNLLIQMKSLNAVDKFQAVLDEVPKVREDLGFPPLVTPMSQIVGAQAVFNIVTGERYKVIPTEIRNYVRGLYGKPAAPISDEIRKLIIGDEEVITVRPADLLENSYEQMKEEIGGLAKSEQDVLSYALFPPVAKAFFEKRAGK